MMNLTENTITQNGRNMSPSPPYTPNNKIQTHLKTYISTKQPHPLSTINFDTENHKNQKSIDKQNKNTCSTNKSIEIITIDSSEFSTPDNKPTDTTEHGIILNNNINSNIQHTPQRRWRNIGGNALQRLLNPPTDTHWQPSTSLPTETSPPTTFASLLHNPLLDSIYEYCQSPRITTILRLKRKPDIHITTKDLRDIIQHNTPIYHESLILCSEVICIAYEGTYLDPSFIPTLKTQGWQGVSNRFVLPPRSKIDQPHFNHPNIIIPVHVNGNHWIALCRRIINGVVHFLYADDLNMPRIESELRRLLQSGTSTDFYPLNARWITCKTPQFQPHSNECGPRTMLAIAVMISHPAPHPAILLPYVSPNLAQYSRHWMCLVLLTGSITLLPPQSVHHSHHPPIIHSNPSTLIHWANNQQTHQRTQEIKESVPLEILSTSNTPGQHKVEIISPIHQLINQTHAKQLSQHNGPSTLSITTIRRDPNLPKIVGTQKQLAHQPKYKVIKKQLHPPTQLTIFDTLPDQVRPNIKQQLNDTWGHFPDPIDHRETFRIFFNNPNGLKLTSDPISVQYSCSLLHSLGAGGVCIAESNVNWSNIKINCTFRTILRKIWKHSTLVTSHNTGTIKGEIQPGGTLTLLTNNWTSRVIERGSDPYGMGRWSYTILRGKEGKRILLVTAYRVCTQSISSIGPTTSTSQQYRHLSKEFREANINEDPQPRKQFIIDLQAWIEYYNRAGCFIILSIDANESIKSDTGAYCPLDFTLDKPISTKGHDGTIATLIRTCGLCDPLIMQHTVSPPPPTYRRGKERIDFLFVSYGLFPAVTRSGILPYDQYFIGDHRPCYMDFDSNTLFGSDTPTIAPSQYRGLQLYDPRIVKGYEKFLLQQVTYHKLQEKTNELLKIASTGHWTEEHTSAYEKIDKLLTESMLAAERAVSKKFSTTYAWSPALKKAVSSLRYWKLCLKRANGLLVPDTTLKQAQEEAEINPTQLPTTLYITDVVKHLREARTTLSDYQKRHLELRMNHIQELAEARVLTRSPSLESPKETGKLAKRTEKEVRRILYKERKRQLFKKLGFLLFPDRYNGGLSGIDIPKDTVLEPFPVGPDPQTWQQSWTSITDPEAITKHISAANARQYHQAHDTPFGKEPLKSYFGYRGDTKGAEQLIEGQLPDPEIMQQLMPETQSILHYLARFPKQEQKVPTSPTIMVDHFQRLYARMDERTSSSPSGRHLGHYKVAAKSDWLSELHAAMMSIPYKVGISPQRWQQIVDVMLEKKPGERKIHRLRIVALLESDYNQSNRLLFSRPLQHALEDSHQLPDIQHGSRASKRCHSAVLNKVLTYEIHRYKKQPLAYIENDAKGCYDRIINPLVLIFLRILGLSSTAISTLAKTWELTVHRIKTLFGISTNGYANSPDYILYGPGQGSTIGPFLWLLCFLLIFAAMSPTSPKMVIYSVNTTTPITFIGEAFVDDAGLGTNDTQRNSLPTPEHALVHNLQQLAQEWERLLYSTGGALNLQKCFWFLLSWKWEQGKAKLQSQSSFPAQLTMTSGADPNPTVIKRIEPTDTFRTLGVHVTPDGTSKGAFTILQDIALNYASILTGTHVTRQEALTTYIQYILPKLRYQPPLLALTLKQCDTLQSIILKAVLPKLHINRHTARSIVHGPIELGGLALPHIYTMQGVDKLNLLLGHLRLQDRTGQLIHADLSYLQLLSGSGTMVLNLNQAQYSWVEQGWLSSVWTFANNSSLQFVYPNQWVPTLPRAQDQYIMEYFLQMDFSNNTMQRLNRCRLYLQAITISDITSACGAYILSAAKTGSVAPIRQSTLNWVYQGKPSKTDWSVWKSALEHLERGDRLRQPLGQWVQPTHQLWEYYYHPMTDILYYAKADTILSYNSFVRPNPKTRQQHRPWFDLSKPVSVRPLPHDSMHPVTVDHDSALTGSLCRIDISPNSIPVPVATPQQPGQQFYTLGLGLESNLIPYAAIAEAIVDGSIFIQCSSNYNKDTRISTSTLSFYHTHEIYSFTSLGFSTKTRRRAELTSIMAALYILTRIDPQHGQATLSSNNKKALQDSFGLEPLGITLATQSDYDLILEIRRLHLLLVIPITPQHGPQTNAGVPEGTPLIQQPVQSCQDFISAATPQHRALVISQMAPSHVITVVKHQELVYHPLRTTVSQSLHHAPLILKLQKDNHWNDQHLSLIDWDAYSRAILKHPRSHRISITKLSHSLWNTNKQNNRYYGETSLCPCCHHCIEDIPHIFTCTQPEVAATRSTALSTLQLAMKKSTPHSLYESVFSGIAQWLVNPHLTEYLAPTSGSLLPQLQSISKAFHAQSSIGWAGMFRGHIASGWAEAFCNTYEAPSGGKRLSSATIHSLSQQWSTKLIMQLWQFSKTIWAYRNAVVHGQTEFSRVSKERLSMQTLVSQHYAAYQDNQHYIPRSRSFLFNRSEDAILALKRDAMASWLALVEEAVLTQQHRQQVNTTPITQFFIRRTSTKANQVNDVWRAPFSAAYYRRQVQHRTPRATQLSSLAGFKRTPGKGISTHSRSKRSQYTSPTLFDLGFHPRATNKPADLNLGRRQRDKDAEKTEYSGTLVSTVP